MAFKMKGHKLPGPYQQKKKIDASAPEYNQPVDNENTKRVMEMRANQLNKAQTDRDTYVSDVNTYAEKHGLTEDQHAKATEKLGEKQKAYDMKLDAHNFSADSANTAIANQNKRIADAAAAAKKDEGNLFKQKKSPYKVAPIVAQLAPKVIGAVAGNMMSKKSE